MASLVINALTTIMIANATQNSHCWSVPDAPRIMTAIGALGGKKVRKYDIGCGGVVRLLIKNIGRIVRMIMTLEKELASLAVGETAPIATQNEVNRK